jgi:tRNA A37 threonylcarbamoyladenosine biosynthesis protein TsaE
VEREGEVVVVEWKKEGEEVVEEVEVEVVLE